jgi:hypothetical protein
MLSKLPDRVLQGSGDREYLQRSKLQACAPDVPPKPQADCRSQTRPDGFRSLSARLRAEEPRETFDSVKKRLRKQGKLSG